MCGNDWKDLDSPVANDGVRTNLYGQVSNKDLKYCLGLSFLFLSFVIGTAAKITRTA